MNGRAPLWYALELELLKNPWRFLLQLLCHFMIGWIVFQLIITIITGMFLLGILLFYPEAFFLPVVTPEKLNHFSFELWSFFKLCIWRYGVIAGFLFMLGYTITKGLKLARCLKR
ncbi:TPA: D-alanyl-D-alanine dipeptidase [Salmonella enterica]|nr:D-alanyl-D-alanine dipeptidase [Salmonella enterica]